VSAGDLGPGAVGIQEAELRLYSEAFRRPDRSRVGVYLIGALFRQDICLTVPALVGLWPNCAVVVFDGRPARPIPLSKAGSPDGK